MNAIHPPAHELEVAHTAIMLHWDAAAGSDNTPQCDRTFITPGILQGSELHAHVDALLEEHAPATDGSIDCITDVSVFWHHPDGRWELEEFVSHYYASGA